MEQHTIFAALSVDMRPVDEISRAILLFLGFSG
jgi:hypothetical protein